MPELNTEKKKRIIREMNFLKFSLDPESIAFRFLEELLEKIEKRAEEKLKEIEKRAENSKPVFDIGKKVQEIIEKTSVKLATKIAILEKGEKGEKGDVPTRDQLLNLIMPLIPKPVKGEPGHTPNRDELEAIIKPLIPDKDELEAIIKPLIPDKDELEAIIKPLIPEGSSDSPEDIKNKLELLEGDERLKIEAIKGLTEKLEEMDTKSRARSSGGVLGSSVVTPRPLFGISTDSTPAITGAINGSNTEFVLPKSPITRRGENAMLSLFLNGVRQREGASNDYTISGKTITFNDAPLTNSILTADLFY